MNVQIMSVSNDGTESFTCAADDNYLLARAKACRMLQNKMVCIIRSGERTHRWDRELFSGRQNVWRRVSPDETEILGPVLSGGVSID